MDLTTFVKGQVENLQAMKAFLPQSETEIDGCIETVEAMLDHQNILEAVKTRLKEQLGHEIGWHEVSRMVSLIEGWSVYNGAEALIAMEEHHGYSMSQEEARDEYRDGILAKKLMSTKFSDISRETMLKWIHNLATEAMEIQFLDA